MKIPGGTDLAYYIRTYVDATPCLHLRHLTNGNITSTFVAVDTSLNILHSLISLHAGCVVASVDVRAYIIWSYAVAGRAHDCMQMKRSKGIGTKSW